MTPIRSSIGLAILICFAVSASVAQESKSTPTNQTLFRSVPASESNVNFVSKLIPDHPRAFLYHSGMTCSGLAVGDLNGDQLPDLVLANGPKENAIYINQGSFKFKEVTNQVTGFDGGEDWASGVSLADMDNDGDLDIYVCNYEAQNRLFINNSSPEKISFTECAELSGVAVVDASHFANFCDYDNDGDLDFYLLTNRVEDPNGTITDLPVKFVRPGVAEILPEAERYYDIWTVDYDNWGVTQVGRPDILFRNDGVNEDGSIKFTDATQIAGIDGRGDGLSTTWFDYDLDGDSDLYVCNDFISEDRFYVNNGDGTFSNLIGESFHHTTWFSMGSNFGDLENDGDFDLMVADMAATSHYKSKVTMGIMGGIELQRANNSFPPQYMRNALHINDGVGEFREGAFMAGLANSDWTWAVKLCDFDADGLLDVYFTNGVPREMNHSDIKITQEMLAGKHMWEFFKEGEMRKEQNLAYRNMGDLKFKDISNDWGLGHLGASYGAVTGDFDQDGDLDLVVMNLEENISIYENRGTGKAQVTIALRGSEDNRFGIGALLEAHVEGRKWIAQMAPGRGYHAYDEPLVHFGLGEADQIDKLVIRWPNGTQQVIKDLAVNQQHVIEQAADDIVSKAKLRPTLFRDVQSTGDALHIENEFDDFALQPLLPHQLSTQGPCMAWGDVNGDNHLDVFIGAAAGQIAELRINDGAGNLKLSMGKEFFADVEAEDAAAAFADIDGDGDLDLLVGRGSYEFKEGDSRLCNALYWNDGKGNFTKAEPNAIPSTATNTGTIAVADFDKDGDFDAFIGTRVKHGEYPLSTPSEIWINENGKMVLSDSETLSDLGMVTDAEWSDVDGNGWMDLVVAREWGTVAVFLNDSGELTPSPELGELSKRSGWWNDVACGDVDGDGDIDIVATNIGLNTKYKASLKKPMTVYYGQFDETGKSHIVEVKQEGEICYPERGRSCSSNAMPFIADKFETFHEFGLATLSDIYGDDKLSKAKKFEANTFEHGVFINEGGKFTFTPLPRISQIAPSRAAMLADIDNDNDLDLVLGQNFFDAQSETGRYDGGCGQVLMNRKGQFEPITPQESGLVVRESATEVFVGDLNSDGKQDVAIATNDGPLRLLMGQDLNE